jgi:glycosyltransferase involved in cell wall biosynthesis
MNILLLEPFFTGSHKNWASDFQKFSSHDVIILPMPGYHWKWRMHIGAVEFSQRTQISSDNEERGSENSLQSELPFLKFKNGAHKPDLILATDMLDLSGFLGLTRSWSHRIPVAVYFHENQLTYPWSPTDADKKMQRDNHYAFINYTTALAANKVLFNSVYHKESFLKELPGFLRSFPDCRNLETVEKIQKKSVVLPLALNLQAFDTHKPQTIEKPNRAVVLWNHRWEYDKNPEQFFQSLFTLAEHGVDFRLIVLGESYEKCPAIFDAAREKLADKILHFGYAESFEEYCKWLWMADLLPVTSVQDFFGAGIVEAMYCNTVPLLPKRLAYPEHIPEKFHATFFYDEGDFLSKLQRRIMDVKYLRVMDTQQYVTQYDWQNLIATYDSVLAAIAENTAKEFD